MKIAKSKGFRLPEKSSLIDACLSLTPKLRGKGNYRLALKKLKLALKYAPSEPRLHLELARVYRCMNDYRSSLHRLKSVLKRHPFDCHVHLEFARTYRDMKDYDLSLQEYRKAFKFGLKGEGAKDELEAVKIYKLDALLSLTPKLRGKGNYRLALKKLKLALKYAPSEPRLHLELARVYRRMDNINQCLKILNKLIKSGFNDPEVHQELGLLYRGTERWEQAISEYKTVIRLGFGNYLTHKDLAWLYYRLGNYDQALKQLKKAIELNPVDGSLNMDLARIYKDRKKRYDLARDEFKKARKKGAEDVKFGLELAEACRENSEKSDLNRRLRRQWFSSKSILKTGFIPSQVLNLNKKRQKILLIGLDGATWKVILPLVKEGVLPNIKHLMATGSWGYLETIVPLKSEVVWTAIATGKCPEVNGITDNLVRDPDTGEIVPPTSNLRKAKAIWNILSEHGKGVSVFGWRVTWPAEKISGVMISDRALQGSYLSRGYSEPAFVKLCDETIFGRLQDTRYGPASLINLETGIKEDIFHLNFATHLLKKRKFDLSCIYLRTIDIASHHYWGYMFADEGREKISPEIAKYKNVVRDCYIWCDTVIGSLLKLIDDKDTTVIVVSDHGTKKQDTSYIFSRREELFKAAGLEKINYNSKIIGLEIEPSPTWSLENNIKISGDFTRTEWKAAREKAIDIIKNIKFKETGEPLFDISNYTDTGFVLRTRAFTFEQKQHYHILAHNKEYKISDFLTRYPYAGCHDSNAIIIMSGVNIRRRPPISNTSIYDIVPTLLYLFGLPVAADMPGKVLKGVLDPGLIKKRPIRYIKSYETAKKRISPKPIRSPIDEEILKEKMRSLGYIN